MARPLAVRWAGSRTPTSVTSGGRPGRALLDDVEHVAAVQHGEVGVVRGRVDQAGQDRPGDPLQRLLPGVRRAELERGDAQPVAALLGQVGDEALAAQHRQQVVDARAGQAEVAGDRGGRHRLGVPRDAAAGRRAPDRRRRRWASAQCLRSETQPAAGGCAAAVGARWNGWHEPLARHHRTRRHRRQPPRPSPWAPAPVSFADVVAVARHGAPRGAVAGGAGRGPPYPRGHRGPGRRRGAALRRVHRLRRPRHPAHPHRAAGPAAAQPRALPRRRLGRRGRARGRPRADAAAPVHPGHRPHRRARGGRRRRTRRCSTRA